MSTTILSAAKLSICRSDISERLPPARLRPVQDTLTDEDNLTEQDALFLEVTDVVEERDRLVAS